MNAALAEFDKSFTPEHKMAATTWHRDVDFKPITSGGPLWATEVSSDPTSQQLEAIRLKWEMDVDEMFYVGDNALKVKGLLNGEFGDRDGKDVLMAPYEFGTAAIAETLKGELPCKWLTLVGASRFTYSKSKLLFKLCWPQLVPSSGSYTYVGRIAPLELIKETADA